MSNAPCECFFYCKCVSARQYMFLSDRKSHVLGHYDLQEDTEECERRISIPPLQVRRALSGG